MSKARNLPHVIGVTMVRNEEDIIEGTIRHQLGELDSVYVLDHGSTDSTPAILAGLVEQFPDRLTVVRDGSDPGYRQSEFMTRLADMAYARVNREPTWIVPFDADELWYADHRVADVLRQHAMANVIGARLYDYRPTAVDPANRPDPFQSIRWRSVEPAVLPKVAVRWRYGLIIDQGNHAAMDPNEMFPDALKPYMGTSLRIAHYPYRSAEQFTRKALQGAAAYAAAADLNPEWGAHWRSYGDLADRFGTEILGDIFRQYFWALSPTDFRPRLTLDPAPYRRWEASK